MTVGDYLRTTFTAKEGAPEKIWAMAETRDGWLWFGGSTGLKRFDGVEFENVDVSSEDGTLSAGVAMLYALPSGGLVIGHMQGGVTILRDGVFTRFAGDDLKAAGRPLDIAADRDGTIWATFDHGVMRFDGNRWTRVGADWNVPAGTPQEIYVDADGALWLHTRDHVTRLARGAKRFESVAVVPEPGVLVQAQDGFLYFRRDAHARSPAARWMGAGRDAAEASRKGYGVYFDRSGNYWAVVSEFAFPDRGVTGLQPLGTISTFLQDGLGNVWIAAQRTVVRLRPSPFVRIAEPGRSTEGRPLLSWINVVADARGTIWFSRITSPAAGTARSTRGLWSVQDGVNPVLEHAVLDVHQVAADPLGDVWAAGGTGLWTLQGGHFTRRTDFADNDGMPMLAAGCAGGVWAVAKAELFRFSRGAWQDGRALVTLPAAAPTSLHCDPVHNLWLGYGDGRLARIDEALKATLFRFVGPNVGAISSISVGRHTLVGGARGLAVLRDGALTRVSSAQPGLEGITGIVESSDGGVWLNGARGVIRVWSSDLETPGPAENIRAALFDADDGFPAPAYSLAWPMTSLALGGDGRVWVAGQGGLSILDPAQVVPAPQAPHVVFKALTTRGRALEPVADAMSLPEGTRNVDIAYTALGALHPERLRFRYRMDGVDDDWVQVDARRRASYTSLSPGAHRFQVDVSDEFGRWANHPSNLTFDIPPTFVQSRAFQALCIATALGLLVVAYRLRIAQLDKRHRQLLAERLDERERIARELHDTLLQGTQGLIVAVQAAANRVPNDDPVRAMLQTSLNRANRVMAEGRDRIHALRSADESANDPAADAPAADLPRSLALLAEELRQDREVRFDAIVEGRPRDLVPAIGAEILLIAREALINAFQHADADAIEVRILFADDEVAVRIRDDGRGIDATDLGAGGRQSHWGLPGMRERGAQIGATLEIRSRVEAGTEIALRVPAKTAYVGFRTS